MLNEKNQVNILYADRLKKKKKRKQKRKKIKDETLFRYPKMEYNISFSKRTAMHVLPPVTCTKMSERLPIKSIE